MVKAKSRLVVRGFKQREGVDFSETFAPTVSSSCVRLLSAIACECDFDLCHFDEDQAFVQSDLEEDVFLRLPKRCGDLLSLMPRLMLRLPLIRLATFTAALAASAAIVVFTSLAPPAAFGFEASG